MYTQLLLMMGRTKYKVTNNKQDLNCVLTCITIARITFPEMDRFASEMAPSTVKLVLIKELSTVGSRW